MRRAFLTIVLLLVAAPARADEAPATDPLSVNADETLVPDTLPTETEFKASEHGLALSLSVETAAFGYAALTQASGDVWGSRSFLSHRVLTQWTASLGPSAGLIANSYTPEPIVGGSGAGSGELGLRVLPDNDWSPYIGFGAKGGIQALAVTNVPLRGYDRVNNVAGEAGVNGSIAGRVTLGGSWMQLSRSLVAGAFLQEDFRTPPTLPSGVAYNELGFGGSYTLSNGLLITLEGLYGSNREETDRHFHSVNRSIYMAASGALRMRLGSRMWLAVEAHISDDEHTASFPGAALVYHTSAPIDGAGLVAVGMARP
ncbi:MAG: hypothetical protein JST54_22290 [Deltaproteobacteria bacterium]|nr:hypothetical protein [Deltaproteobacteria bacterium]